MKVTLFSIFPDLFDQVFSFGQEEKSLKNKVWSYTAKDLRDFSPLKHKQVDDTVYGGGAGMLYRFDVLSNAIKSLGEKKDFKVVLPSPKGDSFNQDFAKKLSQEKHLVFMCPRYEGIDERFVEAYVDYEVSLGDYVLTSGDVAAITMLSTIIRLLPGYVGNAENVTTDTFEESLLKYPQYTKPAEHEGKSVPEVLLSGNHGKIQTWRHQKRLEYTLNRRPDLLKKAKLSESDLSYLKALKETDLDQM